MTIFRLYDLFVESKKELSLSRYREEEPEDLWTLNWEKEELLPPNSQLETLHDVLDFDGRRRLQVFRQAKQFRKEGEDQSSEVLYFSYGKTQSRWDERKREIGIYGAEDLELNPGIYLERVVAPIAFLLLRSKTVALHASAVATEKGALVFIGHSGAGKSTTALELSRKGLPLLADDLVIIDLDRLELLSATATVRLFDKPEAVPEALDHVVILPELEKFWYRLPEKEISVRTPLCKIYSLEHSQEVEGGAIMRSGGADSLVRLLKQSFDLSNGPRSYKEERFRGITALAKEIPVYALRYRQECREEPAQVKAILDHLEPQ